MSTRIRRSRSRQEGIALISAIMVGMVLVFLATVLVWITARESAASARDLRYGSIEQVAEAGIDDYIAKLAQDRAYPTRFVHPAENPRNRPGGGTIAPGAAWSDGPTWTYASSTTWRKMGNGYEYNLRVTPPTPGSNQVTLIATGRQVDKPADKRSFEAIIRPATPLDYQMMSEIDLSFGPEAVTRGKLYAGVEIKHQGSAYANVLAESTVNPKPTRYNGAHWYTGSGSSDGSKRIRDILPNEIQFTDFLNAMGEVKNASYSPGALNLDDANVGAWRLQFINDAGVGKVKVTACSKATGTTYSAYYNANSDKVCDMYHAKNGTYSLAGSNGAIYVGQIALVRGEVNGRVTVASNGDGIVVEGATTYTDRNDDTLGLINPNEGLQVAKYVSSPFNWYANILVPHGTFGAPANTNAGSRRMKYVGSVTMKKTGGFNTNFGAERIYEYDQNLASVQPPYFPVIEDQYTLGAFREVQSPAGLG